MCTSKLFKTVEPEEDVLLSNTAAEAPVAVLAENTRALSNITPNRAICSLLCIYTSSLCNGLAKKLSLLLLRMGKPTRFLLSISVDRQGNSQGVSLLRIDATKLRSGWMTLLAGRWLVALWERIRSRQTTDANRLSPALVVPILKKSLYPNSSIT